MFDRIAALLIALASSTTLLGVASASHPDWVRFDLPPTTMAVSEEDPEIVTITLRLSSMIASPTMPRATAPRTDQWIVTCRPRTLRESGDGAGISRSNLSVIDYFPRTETASDVSSPIAVKQSEEQTQTTGLSVDATYHPLLQGQLGADHGSKSTSTLEFNRHAPVQAVTAAGTIDRGHGVYFKLRWTATQVLEGEKQFKITLRVPHDWRGSLIDVSVRADRTETRLGGFDQETVTLDPTTLSWRLIARGTFKPKSKQPNLPRRNMIFANSRSRSPIPRRFDHCLRCCDTSSPSLILIHAPSTTDGSTGF